MNENTGVVVMKVIGKWLTHLNVKDWIIPISFMAMLLILWELLVWVFDVKEWLLPAPSSILQEMIVSRDLLFNHSLTTITEIIIGFAFSFVIGVCLAATITYSNILERFVYPFIIASQTVPVIVIAPLLLIWIGYGIVPKIIVVILISFFPIVVNTVDGLKSADYDTMRMMRTLGASKWQIFVKLQVPYSIPFLFSGMRVAITLSVIGAVIGEWVGSSSGLGYLIMRSAAEFLTDRVFASMVILSAIGIFLFLLIVIIERLYLPWYNMEKRQY
jgi:ABC-type nitrate/sulfonate/bicarbonate transport system permease component